MSSDPFDVLRAPLLPRRPRAQFAVALRRRLEEELGMTMTDHTPTVARGQVGIVHIKVEDADRAMGFFGPLFGWQSERFASDAFTAHYVINTSILTVLTDDPAASTVRLFFPVPDVPAAVRQLEGLGGRVLDSEIADDGGGWARCEDDQGVPLGLWRPTDAYRTDTPTTAPIGEVGYLTIRTPDTERGRTFHRELFGWEFDEPKPNDYHHVVNTRLPLGLTGDPDELPVHLYFRVADLEPVAAKVLELGGDVADRYESPSGAGCTCQDDQGTRFDLWQAAPGY